MHHEATHRRGSGLASGGRGTASPRRGRDGGDRQRDHLSGRVRQARPRQARRDDPRHGVLDRLDDQGDHRRAAMQLVEQGKLSLDAPIGKVLPDLAALQVFEGFDATASRCCAPPSARSRSGICSPTRRAIATTSGTPRWAGTWSTPASRASRPARTSRCTIPLVFDPGESWEYGINIDWAGKAVEAVSGKRLDAYLKTTFSRRSA